MICTVSTVRDTPDNVEAFARRNLAAGADHMYVFLDDDDDVDGVAARLAGDQHVTVITTDDSYWHGARPQRLNARQSANANLVNVLLTALGEVDWLFHIDGDECLDIHPDVLAAVPAGAPYVRLNTLEAVARRAWEDGEVTHFKRRLAFDDLCLLQALGAISEPDNASYFNGHVEGKPGIRPSVDIRIRIHTVRGVGDIELPVVRDDRLNVLHYESYCEDEFIRKWQTHVSGRRSPFKASKDRLRGAVTSVLGNDRLSDEAKQQLLAEIFRRCVEDDWPRLRDLGVLAQPQPRRAAEPRSYPTATRERHDDLIGRLRTFDKDYFVDQTGAGLAVALQQLKPGQPAERRRLPRTRGRGRPSA